ncbi:MAG: HDOD domain-containing protein [bacterium]|nr:HDOD domain-containing protein [bacterium]
MRDTILSLLKKHGDLPFLPDNVQKIEKKLNDPKSNISDIARIIEIDPTLAGKVLTLANSAYYSRGVKSVTTLQSALSKLGLKEVVKLVYSIELTRLFVDNKVLDSSKFWKHSLAVANVSQILGIKADINQDTRDLAYLAGLMHDIGVMVFCYLIPEEYSDFLKEVSKNKQTLQSAEIIEFGIDHAELGAQFINKWWDLDERIVSSVFYHHSIGNGSSADKKCRRLVSITNGICNKFGITNGIKTSHKEDNSEDIGLTGEEIHEIRADIESAIKQAEELLN